MSDRALRERIDQMAAAQRGELEAHGWWHSIDLGGGRVTPGAHRLDELRDNYARFGLPADLGGRRVLDIGCWDGFYSFEAERHGAAVVSVDCWRPPGFFIAHRELGSRAEFEELSVYEVTRERVGTFDIVLFLGVLYHLRHPLLALERVCEVTRDFAVIETHAIDNIFPTSHPVMEFYELDELGGQYDNWWGPNGECLVRMARAAGFARVEVLRREPTRVVVKASRGWAAGGSEPSPDLCIRGVTNAVTFDERLHRLPRRGRHAFLAVWVEGLPLTATRENVGVEVGGLGIKPIFVGQVSDPRYAGCAQINAPVPPGLDVGATSVRVIHDGRHSNEVEIRLEEGSEW